MNFWECVDDLLDRNGISKKTLAIEAGFDPSNITKGIKNGNIPAADTAVKIAKVLNVSVEYLVTGKDAFDTKPQSPEGRMLLHDFSSLPARDKRLVLAILREMKNG